jgi:hypothetical protein
MTEYVAVAERLATLPGSLDIPESQMSFRFAAGLNREGAAPVDDVITQEVSKRFTAYSSRYAVAAMITSLELFVLRLYWVALAYERATQQGDRIGVEQIYQFGDEARKKARYTSLVGLIRIVCKQFEIPPENENFDAVASIYAARNCLTHRLGVVGPEDVRDGALELKFRVVRMSVDGKLQETIRGTRVNAGSFMELSFQLDQRTFRIGDSVDLTPQDCQSIALTIALMGQWLLGAIGKAIAGRGGRSIGAAR